jgi:hypothetical protein
MPYITYNRRKRLEVEVPKNAGELNYAITTLLIGYWTLPGAGTTSSANYQRINDIIGACEGAKAEFQRRVVAPYEDKKILENGDVYP